MAQPNQPAKTMSSRLLTMKFMQRAAASTSSSAPSTPPELAAKKQRLSNGSYNSVSSTPRSDAQAIQEAIAAEEQKRVEALEREAAHRGETKWYLSYKEPESMPMQTPLRIVSAGYASLDAPGSTSRSSEEDGEISSAPQIQGRRSFGKFNRKIEKQQDPDVSSSSPTSSSDSGSSEADEEGEESDDPTGAKAMIAQSRKEAGEKARSARKAKRKAEKAESERLAEERRKKHVKLNKLTSISGSGSTLSGRSPRSDDRACHKCGERGHLQKDCPQRSQQRSNKRSFD